MFILFRLLCIRDCELGTELFQACVPHRKREERIEPYPFFSRFLFSFCPSFFFIYVYISMVATNLRGGKRLALLAVLFTAFTVYILSKFSRSHTTCHAARSLYQLRSFSEENHTSSSSSSYYLNLNSLNATAQAAERGERLLVLTPLLSRADAADHLERYFDLLDKTTYPNRLISIGLLITDSMDGALEVVEAQVKRLENRWFNRFHEIHVYTRDFPFLQSTAQDTIAYRRTVMARARNFLLASALRDYHSWVAWLDVDLVQYPATIFDDLMRVSHADVIVPNCLMFRTDQCFWAYDRSNWQDTDYSLERQKHFGQDYVFVEG